MKPTRIVGTLIGAAFLIIGLVFTAITSSTIYRKHFKPEDFTQLSGVIQRVDFIENKRRVSRHSTTDYYLSIDLVEHPKFTFYTDDVIVNASTLRQISNQLEEGDSLLIHIKEADLLNRLHKAYPQEAGVNYKFIKVYGYSTGQEVLLSLDAYIKGYNNQPGILLRIFNLISIAFALFGAIILYFTFRKRKETSG